LRSRTLPTATVEFITADDAVVEVEFRAIPVFVYEALLRDHPPQEGDRTPWNAATFVPAMLAASTAPPELDAEFWTAYAENATARTIADLIDVVQTLNGIGSVKR
jgi:hypothetical protein